MIINQLFEQPIVFLYFVVALLIGITFHEFSHAWAAYKLGDPTPKIMGRLTLNPLAHLDPLGTIFLFLAGFGWGKPVFHNPKYFQNPNRDTLLTALAGPLANILIAFIFLIPFRVAFIFNPEIASFWLFNFFYYIIFINLLLAAFNILPIPPLDGFKILYLFLDKNQIFEIERIGPFVLFGIIILSLLTSYNFLGQIIFFIIKVILFLLTAILGSVNFFPIPNF